MAGTFSYVNRGSGAYDVWTRDGTYLGMITKTKRGWGAWTRVRPLRVYRDRDKASEALRAS